MKSTRSVQYFLFLLVSIVLTISATSAQSRYKHLPRVKIQKQPTVSPVVVNQDMSSLANGPSNTREESPVIVNNEETKPENQVVDQTAVNDQISHNETIQVKSKHSSVKQGVIEKIRFVHQMNEHKKLSKPEDTEKTNSISIILMIIFYILGAIFTIMAVIFILLPPFDITLFIIFLILGLVFTLAGGVLSMLLRYGVIS